MKLKKVVSVALAVLLALTVCSATAFAATSGYDVDEQGAGTPRVTDAVESYLAQYG